MAGSNAFDTYGKASSTNGPAGRESAATAACLAEHVGGLGAGENGFECARVTVRTTRRSLWRLNVANATGEDGRCVRSTFPRGVLAAERGGGSREG